MTLILTRSVEPKVWRFQHFWKIEESQDGQEVKIYDTFRVNTPIYVRKDTILSAALDLDR